MAARFEVTKRYARAYAAAPRKGKSVILDHVVQVTGWNRDHARQQLVARLKQAPGRAVAPVAVIDRRRTKPPSARPSPRPGGLQNGLVTDCVTQPRNRSMRPVGGARDAGVAAVRELLKLLGAHACDCTHG